MAHLISVLFTITSRRNVTKDPEWVSLFTSSSFIVPKKPCRQSVVLLQSFSYQAIGMPYHSAVAQKKHVCLSQHSGSQPVASPGSTAQLGQFVKLETRFCIFCGSFLVMLSLKQPISSAYHHVDSDKEEDAVNIKKCAVVPRIGRGNLFILCRNGVGKGCVLLSEFYLQPREENRQKAEPVFAICSHLKPHMHSSIQLTFL